MTQGTKQDNYIQPNMNIPTQQVIYQDDEIDLRELFFILWNRKLWIIIFTLFVAILSSIYAIMQPNIYESKAVFKINGDPYGILASKGSVANLATNNAIANALAEPFEYLKSKKVQQQVAELAQVDPLNLNISMDKKSGDITVLKQGKNPQAIFDDVSIYSQYINQVYMQDELDKVKIQLIPVKQLLEKQEIPEVKKVLAEKYAYLIYKETLLESGSVALVKLTTEAFKPTSHIKPKRALIVILATLLAGMLSIFIALTHYFLTKKEEI